MLLSFPLLLSTTTLSTRTVYDLDHGWKFQLVDVHPTKCNSIDPFTMDLTGQKTGGLKETPATTEATCHDACCARALLGCTTAQFCNTSVCGCGPPQQPCCWIGKYWGEHTTKGEGWYSRARKAAPTPSPSPGPSGICEETSAGSHSRIS